MASLLKTGFTAEYSQAHTVARTAFREHNDCAVIAVSIACGVTYETAHAALKAAGRQDRKGTYAHQTVKAIESLGFRVRTWDRKELRSMIDSYPGIHATHKNITTHHPRRFAKAWEGSGNLLLRTQRHILACKDGTVHDWSINRSL